MTDQLRIPVDSYDYERAVALLNRRAGCRPTVAAFSPAQRDRLALDLDVARLSIKAREPGWVTVWTDDAGVVHVDAGPKLLALCASLLEVT
jgi:hypothetical protein